MPISTRKKRNVSKLFASPIAITGTDPASNSAVYVRRGPIRSHIQPATNRESTVMATDPTMHQPTWSGVSFNSSRTTFIRGAMPNQAKKQRKNANHDMWKARIAGVEKENSAIRDAFPSADITNSDSHPSTGNARCSAVGLPVVTRDQGRLASDLFEQPRAIPMPTD